MADKIYVGDVGTAILADCGQDVSSATSATMEVSLPDGTTASWTAAPMTYGGSPNYLVHYTQAGDLPLAGRYKIQPKFTLSGWTGRAETDTIRVYEEFK